ncbi:unnamed protein product [Pleuronectes platessa]|uniref:Uncharacterized protein n=1 Tax=Pleuronectes platessa TaxID=8262 RepID=A0A9N7Y993_PLEPL|nr:unnamed protein product [Pleuronectes platessa]
MGVFMVPRAVFTAAAQRGSASSSIPGPLRSVPARSSPAAAASVSPDPELERDSCGGERATDVHIPCLCWVLTPPALHGHEQLRSQLYRRIMKTFRLNTWCKWSLFNLNMRFWIQEFNSGDQRLLLIW